MTAIAKINNVKHATDTLTIRESDGRYIAELSYASGLVYAWGRGDSADVAMSALANSI